MTDHPEHGLGLQDNTEVLQRISARPAGPAALPVAAVRIIRDEIHDRVKALTASLLNNPGSDKEELDA
ncbi:hypothetical protein SAMN04487914_12650 [Arthrobacter sp. ok909]|jgi:hypothetical protein|uniref:hypothetical protein n=1 Tax=Arthrobacter sp. ok909 TaxID=1761746 RepID=UPI000884EBB0|nr:hypothetical protein [Arthrobacter sp. ok909]SDP68361.1 hypothetical protein SAMN04487914_12650 [Arthrobacter sp. ok909]